MSEALTRPKPQIDHPAELERIVRQIVEQVDPVAIYLFGSRARGDADDDSDYDLLVVLPDEASDDRLKMKWRFPPGTGSLDVKLRHRAWFASRLARVGALEHEVACESVQLYPRDARPFGFEAAKLVRADALPDLEIAQEWLKRAKWHLEGGERLCEEFPETSAFFVQQTAENLTKAALVAHHIRPPSGRDIGKAAANLPPPYEDRDRFLSLGYLSDFFWAYRYPSPPGTKLPPKPSALDIKRWLEGLKQLLAGFERWLGQAAGGGATG